MSASKNWLLGLTLGCGCVAVAAEAGVYVERIVRNVADGTVVPGVNMYIEKGMARIEDLRGKRPHVTIFRDEAMYILEPAKKTYSVMDKASVERMSGQMGDAMQQMQAELAKMSPEQRAMVEQMMKQGGGGPGMGPPGAGDGKPDPNETIVKEWTTRSNPADLFNVPGDYKRLH
jgi:hypothetical protein